jgi:hypothetical protein
VRDIPVRTGHSPQPIVSRVLFMSSCSKKERRRSPSRVAGLNCLHSSRRSLARTVRLSVEKLMSCGEQRTLRGQTSRMIKAQVCCFVSETDPGQPESRSRAVQSFRIRRFASVSPSRLFRRQAYNCICTTIRIVARRGKNGAHPSSFQCQQALATPKESPWRLTCRASDQSVTRYSEATSIGTNRSR